MKLSLIPREPDLGPYLAPSPHIDWHHPAIVVRAAELASGCHTDLQLVQRCFEFVRDEIRHSGDFRQNPVTCTASDVLKHGTGYCYAKSHLLAALLRANDIPAGLCYQRLSLGDAGPPYCLHGLNAVFLIRHGWHRVDARGNKPGVDAQFSPPREQLAFPALGDAEFDFPDIWAEPLPEVVHALTQYSSVEELHRHLPDAKPAGSSRWNMRGAARLV